MILAKKAKHYFDRTESEQDLYSVLSPVVTFCQISGIFPLRLKGPAGKRKYSSSNILIFYNLVTLALSMIALSTSLWIVDQNTIKLPDHIVVAASHHTEFSIATWSMVVIIVTPIITRNKFANALDTLSSQDKMLRDLGVRINYSADLMGYYGRLGINLLAMTTLFALDFMFQLHFNLRYPIVWVSLMYSATVRIISICLYVEIILALRQRFAVLNEYLRKMIKETENFSLETASRRVDNFNRLRSIAKIHGELYEVAMNVSKMFGFNTFMAAIYALKLLINSSFYISKEIQGPIDLSWIRIAGYLNWGTISFVHIVYLITACTLAQTQANLMGKLIHKFQNNEGVTPFGTMLRSFSLQLYHQRVEFSAVGFFSLDVTLLQSIVEAVLTFLVILLQLDIALPEESQSQSTNTTLN